MICEFYYVYSILKLSSEIKHLVSDIMFKMKISFLTKV